MKWGRGPADLLAGPAAELLPHMFGDEQLPRHHIQRLGDILADLRKFGAAAARAAGRRGMNDAPVRQVSREIAACLALREALRRNAGGLGLGLILAGQPPIPPAAVPTNRSGAGCARNAGRTAHAFILAISSCRCSISTSAAKSLARASINAAFSASLSS